MTLLLSSNKFGEFKAYLEKNGYTFEDRAYQQFLARKVGIVINLYLNGKIVFGGADQAEKTRVEEYLGSLRVSQVVKHVKEYPAIEVSGTRIGTDESGKGDYFGPLVIGGVIASEAQAKQLQKLGVKDSKDLSNTAIENLAISIREVLQQTQYKVIPITPIKYNELHKTMEKNVNLILGWGHARAIKDLLATNPACKTAVVDQFGDQSYIKKALGRKGETLTLIQSPKAEREVTVAAASILARSKFVDRMREMSKTYRMEFPMGSTNVIPSAEKFVLSYGGRALPNVAKVHFSITSKIPNLTAVDLDYLRSEGYIKQRV